MFVAFCVWFLFCYAVVCVLSSFTLILTGKRELVALLVFLMPCDRKCSVALSHGTVARLQCVIIVFSDYSHLLFQKWSQIIYFMLFKSEKSAFLHYKPNKVSPLL